MFGNFDLVQILLRIPGIVVGLAFHEFAHAAVSDRLGDPTPRSQGRLTISPLPHIDPIGFIMIILLGFGWAKPVQVNPRYYKHPRRDDMLVSVAGPAANLVTAIFFTLIAKILLSSGLLLSVSENVWSSILGLIDYTIWINIILFLFNLLPVPPLDGFHILADLVPYSHYRFIDTIRHYSSIILIILIVSGVTGYIIGVPANYIYHLLTGII